MIFGRFKINTAVSILFAPSFVLGMYFWGFNSVALWSSIFMFLYLLYAIVRKQDLKTISTPIIYFVFVLVAYSLESMSFVKLIPALISAGFFILFFLAFIANKEMVLGFAKRFSPKEIDEKTQRYLAKSDAYWAVVLLTNTLTQLALVFYDNNELWAFYSSVGWYFYMLIALTIQIIYVKIQVSKEKK